MIATLFWKEFREQRAIFLTLAGFATLVALGMVQFAVPAGVVPPGSDKAAQLWLVALITACAYGAVCGSVLLAGEREARTMTFLDALARERTRVWLTKAVVGFLLTVTLIDFLWLLLAALGAPVQGPRFTVGGWKWEDVGLLPAALWAFSFGMLAGPLCRHVLSAVVWSLAGVCVTAFVETVLDAGRGGFGGGMVFLEIVLPALALAGSWAFCCRDDLERWKLRREERAQMRAANNPGTDRVWVASLAWKDYREHRPVWLSLAAISTFLLVGTPQVFALQGTRPGDSAVLGALVGLGLTLAVAYGLLCGSMMLAGEHESSTLVFLDALLCRRTPIWSTKLRLGIALTLAHTLVVVGLLALVILPFAKPAQTGWDMVLVFMGFGVMSLAAFATAMLVASCSQSTLAAFGISVVVFAVQTLGVILPALMRFEDSGGTMIVIWLLLQGVCGLIALAVARRIFCGTDAGRLPTFPPGEPIRPVTRAPLLRPWRAFLWLSYQQGRLLIPLLLFGAPALTLLLLGWWGLAAWPIMALLLGIVCGLAVFAPEQIHGDYRFLANQRLPLKLFWLTRTSFWFVAATSVGLLIFRTRLPLSRILHVLTGSFGPTDQRLAYLVGQDVYLPIWLAYGFSISQFLALLVQKTAVAAVLAVLTCGLLLVLWLPSLIVGGMSAWVLCALPVFFLGATLVAMRPWVGGTLLTGRPAGYLACFGLLVAAWITGCLWYRFASVPAVGEPFDRRGFEAELASLWQSKSSRLLRQGLAGMRNAVGSRAGSDASAAKADRPLLNQLFRERWFSDLHEAASLEPGVVEDPLAKNLVVSGPSTDLSIGISLLRARGLDLIKRGDDGDALDHLGVMLALSRDFRNAATTSSFTTGVKLEQATLELYEIWLGGPGPSLPADTRNELVSSVGAVGLMGMPGGPGPLVANACLIFQKADFWRFFWWWSGQQHPQSYPGSLKEALRQLARHEAQVPPLTSCVKAQYLAFTTSLDDPEGSSEWETELLFAARQAPWERTRTDRLVNLFFAGFLRAAGTNYWELGEGPEVWNTPAVASRAPWWHNWLPATQGTDAAVSRRRMAQWIDETNPLKNSLPGMTEILPANAGSLYRQRVVRLRLARALYRFEHGWRQPTLDQLVPQYLPEPLINPFTGKALAAADLQE